MSRKPSAHRRAHDDRGRLRAEVLQVGGQLGWEPHEVISFTEALTGRAWHGCGRDELEAALAKYETLRRVIAAKRALVPDPGAAGAGDRSRPDRRPDRKPARAEAPSRRGEAP